MTSAVLNFMVKGDDTFDTYWNIISSFKKLNKKFFLETHIFLCFPLWQKKKENIFCCWILNCEGSCLSITFCRRNSNITPKRSHKNQNRTSKRAQCNGHPFYYFLHLEDSFQYTNFHLFISNFLFPTLQGTQNSLIRQSFIWYSQCNLSLFYH